MPSDLIRDGKLHQGRTSDLKTILAEIHESPKSLKPEIEEANKAAKSKRLTSPRTQSRQS
jgi:hypothetical protein